MLIIQFSICMALFFMAIILIATSVGTGILHLSRLRNIKFVSVAGLIFCLTTVVLGINQFWVWPVAPYIADIYMVITTLLSVIIMMIVVTTASNKRVTLTVTGRVFTMLFCGFCAALLYGNAFKWFMPC